MFAFDKRDGNLGITRSLGLSTFAILKLAFTPTLKIMYDVSLLAKAAYIEEVVVLRDVVLFP